MRTPKQLNELIESASSDIPVTREEFDEYIKCFPLHARFQKSGRTEVNLLVGNNRCIYVSQCFCGDNVRIPGENTPFYSQHLYGCPMLKPYWFYYDVEDSKWKRVTPSFDVNSILDRVRRSEKTVLRINFRQILLASNEIRDIDDD